MFIYEIGKLRLINSYLLLLTDLSVGAVQELLEGRVGLLLSHDGVEGEVVEGRQSRQQEVVVVGGRGHLGDLQKAVHDRLGEGQGAAGLWIDAGVREHSNHLERVVSVKDLVPCFVHSDTP